jgi:hypothetical protein
MHPQSLAVCYRFKVTEKPKIDRFLLFFCSLPITAVIKNGTEAQFVKTPAERIPFMPFDNRPCQRNQSIPEGNNADDD